MRVKPPTASEWRCIYNQSDVNAVIAYLLSYSLIHPFIHLLVGIINVDFANDCASLPYTPLVDCRELIRLEDVMELHELGPNGILTHSHTHTLTHSIAKKVV